MSDLFVSMSLMASNGSKPVCSTSRRRRNLCKIGTPLDSMANSLNATSENIFDETPPKRLKHPVFLERKGDPVCRRANARFGSRAAVPPGG